ncbi:S49 family peptidase, partial [Salmonella enterica]|nr:S49 family peptidase [Salmonella enterica]
EECGYDNLEGVAVIPVHGTLVQKLGSLRPYSGMTGYDGIRHAYLSALADPDVKAICLDIDSPGGEVAGCFDLVDEIYQSRGVKPVHAILTECAYSAAYAIASAADRIVVPRTGGVGSVGVIVMHVDWSQKIKSDGLQVTIITYGDRKAETSPYIPLSDVARASLQDEVDAIGRLFVETVARNRGIADDVIRKT